MQNISRSKSFGKFVLIVVYIWEMPIEKKINQECKIDISSIKSLILMRFCDVMVSTSASHSKIRGSIPCQGIFFYILKKGQSSLSSLSVKRRKDRTLGIKNLRYDVTSIMEFDSVPPWTHHETYVFYLIDLILE